MGKPRVVIADSDEQYVAPMLQQFIRSFFEKIEIELITDKDYLKELFSKPQRIDILIISEDMYIEDISKHNIGNAFLMTEEDTSGSTGDLTINRIFKYTSLKEIFNEIIGVSAETLSTKTDIKKETQTILMYSACGGAGKTTIAVGVAACLSKNHKSVLLIDAEYIQSFQYFLNNKTALPGEVVSKFQVGNERLFSEIQSYIRREGFDYIPPFQASISAYNIDFGMFAYLIEQIKANNTYDYILIDTDSSFSDDKGQLLDQVDKVFIVARANEYAIFVTNKMLKNINHSDNEKFMFICNAYQKENEAAVRSSINHAEFLVNEYINWISECEHMKATDLARVDGMQKIAYSLL